MNIPKNLMKRAFRFSKIFESFGRFQFAAGRRCQDSAHSAISGCLINSSRDLLSNTLSPTLETNDVGKHTVELLNLFLNPRSSDADFDSSTCRCVTFQVFVSNSVPLITPRSKPPAQITFFPNNSSNFIKVDLRQFGD